MPDSTAYAHVLDAATVQPGLTYARLASELGGRRVDTLALLRAAVADGVLHERASRVPTRGGVTRAARGLFPGPAPSTAPEDEGLDLRELRRTYGLSATLVANQLGTSHQLLYHWEAGRQPMPAWAFEALPGAIEQAYLLRIQGPATKRRHARARQAELLREIKNHPGQNRPQLAEALGVCRKTLTLRLEPLLERGRVHWAYSEAAPANGPRARLGLYPGPTPRTTAAPSPRDLHRAAQRVGWTDKRVARRLRPATFGVPLEEAWQRRVREDLPLDPSVDPEAAIALHAELLEEARRWEDEVLALLPASLHTLQRGTGGRTVALTQALHRLEATGRAHRASIAETNAAGVVRYVKVYAAGPGPAWTMTALAGDELAQLRRSRGLSAGQLADRLGVARSLVAHWETGVQPIPAGRVTQLRDLFDELPAAATPYEEPRTHADAELEELALTFLAEHPGSTATATAAAMTGSTQRRLKMLRRLIEAGRLREEPGLVRGKPVSLLYITR